VGDGGASRDAWGISAQRWEGKVREAAALCSEKVARQWCACQQHNTSTTCHSNHLGHMHK
jgi:hypothetical protein